MSFINFNNKTETQSKTYTKTMVLSALLASETKNTSKARTMVSGLNEQVTLNEALALFSNKLNAMTALNVAAIEYKPLLEGQFSWMTHDRGEQIGSERENTINVWMFDNEGNMWYEKSYDGYGKFGGMDYYELVAKMNGYSEEDLDIKVGKRNKIYREMREIGIALAFDELETRDEKGDVLFPALMSDPKGFNYKRHDFAKEAQHDPNQSWYQEPEYEEDENYESKTNEGAISDIHIMAQEAKDFKSFVKAFTKEHHDLSGAGEPGQFEAWLQTIYDDAKESMDESVTNEAKYALRDFPIVDWQRKQFDSLNDMYNKYLVNYANSKGDDGGKMAPNALNNKYKAEITSKLGLDTSAAFADIAKALIKAGLIKESVDEAKSSTYFATAGLSKDETKKVAETLAKAMSKAEGSKVTVNLKTLEEDSFDLDVNGEEFDGGSYNIHDNGSVVNHAVTPNEVYGKIDSSVDDFIKGLKKPLKESVVNEAKKPKTWDTTFAMNAIADYEAGKFDPDNDKSLADWEKEYNGGKKPNPEFETYDIIMWALATGKKPDGTPIKESVVNELFGSVALSILLAWAGLRVLKSVVKKVIGAIGSRAEQPADKLKELTQELVTAVIDETGVGSDKAFNITNLKIEIDKKIDSGEIKNVDGIAKEMEGYLKANESYSVEVNEAVVDLQKYVDDASKKTFKNGGNGQNLLDNAMELAYHIGENQVGRDTRGYEEDGWYEPATVALFKKLVDSMSADDIKNNSEDQYESVVTEGRSINKIQKEWSEVTTKMKAGVEEWKKAPEGELKTSLFDNLKSLTLRKKELEAELDDAVKLKDVDAELAGESFVYEAEIKSDDEFKDYAFDVLKKAFGADFDEAKATKTVDGILSKSKSDYGKAIGMLTAGLGESLAVKPTKAERWMDLLEKVNKSVNEDLRADLKKYIKSNSNELNAYADDDNWEAIHTMLRTDFDVKEGSKEEDTLFTTFNFVF